MEQTNHRTMTNDEVLMTKETRSPNDEPVAFGHLDLVILSSFELVIRHSCLLICVHLRNLRPNIPALTASS